MALISYLRKKFKKQPQPTARAYIEACRPDAGLADTPDKIQTTLKEMEREIDLSSHRDLEDYVRGLSVTRESVERWISSGLLMPDEIKAAEKLVKIMRKR